MQTVTDTPTGTKPSAAVYTAELSAAQIFGFADLVRRLGQAYGPDADRALRQDLVDALNAFVGLLPEPPEEDGDAYLAAVRAGHLPDWGMDDQPLTETPEARAARIRARLTAQGQDVPLGSALNREEAAYAHLASFTGGEQVIIGGRSHILCDEAVIEYPQACPVGSDALTDACLIAAVTGGARVQISVAELLSGARHIEHDSRRQRDGEPTWFDEAGFAARVGDPQPSAVTARSFPGVPESVSAARSWVAGFFPCPAAAADAALMTSELVTNAVLYSASGLPGGQVAVSVRIRDGVTRVGVTDQGPAPVGSALVPGLGLGLGIVRELADACDADGPVRWFELRTVAVVTR